MSEFSIESGTLHIKVSTNSETDEDASVLCNKLFDFLAHECKPQSEAFNQFSVVIFNHKGLFKDNDWTMPFVYDYLEPVK